MNVTQRLIIWLAKPYGLANQKLCYIQMLLNVEKSGEQDQERSEEWLVNTGPDFHTIIHCKSHNDKIFNSNELKADDKLNVVQTFISAFHW